MDKKMFIVAKREFLERVRSRWFIIGTLAFPALMAAAVGASVMVARTGPSSSVRHIAIVDATGTGLGARVASALMADSSLGDAKAPDAIQPSVRVVSAADLPAAETAAMNEVRQPKNLVGYLVLDTSTLKGDAARYAGRNASSISDMEKLSSMLRQEVMMMRLEREGVRQDIVGDLARNRLHLDTQRVTDSGKGGSGIIGVVVGLGLGVLLFMSIMIHGQTVMRGVLEEKTTRVAEVVISSVKPESLLGGKVLGVGAVGLTQIAAWLGITLYLVIFVVPIMTKGSPMASAAAAAGAASGPANPISAAIGGLSPMVFVVALIYFLIGFTFYATLYAAAGSMVNSEQEAQQAAVPVMILAMSTYLLVQPVLAAPSGTLAIVLSWLPWSSPIIMPIRMGLTSVSPVSVVGSMLVAVLGSALAIWVSARIYRVGMLMYGKKPSIAEVVKWVRYA
jgi:ABC-2 type transport system permease protein